MSLFFEDLGSVMLHVTTGNPLAEVFLADHRFALVDRSIGELNRSVTPGVYKVKVQLGDTTAERLVVVDKEKRVDMSSELMVASAAPILGTSRTHEYHMEVAHRESEQVALAAGAGSSIFLMTRSWSAPDVPGPAPAVMSLHRPDGTVVAELGDVSEEVASDADPARAATVEVDPGAYILRWYDDDASEAVEQAVHAVADWQTQVFILREPHDDRGGYSVSMLMTKSGFHPNERMARTTAVAHAALADERRVASETINDSLFAKFDNPMLGLFGAHLMLIASEAEHNAADEQRRRQSKPRPRPPTHFRQTLFDEVVHNLAGILGPDHPDVVALATKTSDNDLAEVSPVTTPPLLWRSWLLLIDASNDHPPLVPADTWRQARRPLPLRPFLTWAIGDEDDDLEAEWRAEVGRQLHGAETPAQDILYVEPSPAGTDRGSPTTGEAERRHLSRQLLVPRAAIDELSAG